MSGNNHPDVDNSQHEVADDGDGQIFVGTDKYSLDPPHPGGTNMEKRPEAIASLVVADQRMTETPPHPWWKK